MILSGKLVIAPEEMAKALENMINSAVKCGGEYIRITEIRRDYNWSDFEISITTDEAKNEESNDTPNAV